MILQRTVLRWSTIVRKEVETSTVRGEFCNLCMAGKIGLPNRIKGLTPRMDKSYSIIGAL